MNTDRTGYITIRLCQQNIAHKEKKKSNRCDVKLSTPSLATRLSNLARNNAAFLSW